MVLNFSEEEITTYLARTQRRKLQSYGIEFESLLFNDDELALVRRQMDPYDRGRKVSADLDPANESDGKVFFKYNPANLECIWVLNPVDRLYIRVPAVFEEYARGLSLRRHKLNLLYARTLVDETVDEEALLRAHREINELIRNAALPEAERLGKALGRGLGLNIDSPEEEKPDAAPPPASPPPEPNLSSTPQAAKPEANSNQGANAEEDYDDLLAESDHWTK